MTTTIITGRLSLLWRTLFLLTLFVAFTQIGLYLWIQRSVTGHLEQMDAEILTHAATNLHQYMMNNTNASAAVTPQQTTKSILLSHEAGLDYDVKAVITDHQGKPISSSPTGFLSQLHNKGLVKDLWEKYHNEQFDLTIDHRFYRAIIIKNSTHLALIALPVDIHHQYLHRFNRQLILLLLATTFILVSVAAFSVHLGFAPLSTIRQKMRNINAEQLNDRIIVSKMPRELKPLAQAYNAMMTNLERNFDALSRFSDDIAHELRTPLATLTTQTQVMLNKPRALHEYVEQLHHQHDTLAQLSVLVNNMLLLAKTEKGLHDSHFIPVDTDSIMDKVIDYYEFIAEDKDIAFKKIGHFHHVLGDDSLLQRSFANLISNAIYYAAEHSEIIIKANLIEKSTDNRNKKNAALSKPAFLEITFCNRLDDPIEPKDVAKLSERFYRHHKQNQFHSGTGLGLSIVQSIVNAHNGKMSIQVNDKIFFEVSIQLPLPQASTLSK